MIDIIFIFINLLFGFVVLFLTVAFVTGAPFVPSTKPVSRKMIEFANIEKGMKVYDLGSGDGRLLALAADRGAMVVGYEINPFLVIISSVLLMLRGYRLQTSVRWKNFWSAPISDADVLFVYLLPWRMKELEQKLDRELKPGTLVVSNSFIFPNWKILQQDPVLHVYAFRVGKIDTFDTLSINPEHAKNIDPACRMG